MIGLSDAMRSPDAPPPDPEREYGLVCLIIEHYAFACRHGSKRDNANELRKFRLAVDYLVENNLKRISGE